MARSISEIKKTMTDAFLADEDLREAYGIEEGATWSDVFSNVSIENILLYVVAACIYVHECAWDLFSEEVNEKIAANVVPTARWYYTRSLEFQYGDELVYNEEKEQFESDEFKKSKEFWVSKFKDEVPLLNMPSTYIKPPKSNLPKEFIPTI